MRGWGAAILLATSLLAAGCGQPGRVAPGLQGPFVDAPTRLWSVGEGDAITRHTEAVYFMWTFPAAEVGTPFRCELRAADVPGAPAGTLFANAQGRIGDGMTAGSVRLVSPDRGWEPGRYRSVVYMNERPFGEVVFDVTGSSW